MKRASGLIGGLVASCIAGATFAAELPPPWAYGFKDPLPPNYQPRPYAGAPVAKPDPALRSLPGAKQQFTRAEINNRFGPADWYPEDHPPMPEVVARGRPPDVVACALCHFPNGKGRPENAPIVGLPIAYFIEQMKHYKNDRRRPADPRKLIHTQSMTDIAKAMTDEEMKIAAEYYGSMKFTPSIKVVETDRVPKTTISAGMFLPVEGGETEPIGNRIIEVPENAEAVDVLRSPRIGFIAYAPVGSIKKGEALVTRSGGKSPLPCGVCHGPDLKGMLNVPAIAGRSPSYIVRQLFDMKSGTRKGPGTDQMKPFLTHLTADDMLAIAAYTASRQP